MLIERQRHDAVPDIDGYQGSAAQLTTLTPDDGTKHRVARAMDRIAEKITPRAIGDRSAVRSAVGRHRC